MLKESIVISKHFNTLCSEVQTGRSHFIKCKRELPSIDRIVLVAAGLSFTGRLKT